MAALREILARFGISADTRGLDRADRRISSTRSSLSSLVAAAGGAATLVAIRRFVSSSVAMGDELDKTAQQVGLTTQQLQAFRHAAELSGVDGAAFANSLGQLQRRALDAAEGTDSSAEAFTRLGISVDQLTGADGQLVGGAELLRLVADGMQNTTNSSVRTATAMELMGRSGRRMLPMLTGGREGLSAMEAELQRLGGGASAEFIRQSVEMTDETTRMRLATTGLKATFLTALLPTMTRTVQWLTKMVVALQRSGAAAALAKPILVALGVAAAGAGVAAAVAWGSTVAPIMLAAAAAAFLYLALDDIGGAIRGDDSVLEEFINSLGFLIDYPALGSRAIDGFREAWHLYFALLDNGLEPMTALGTAMNALWSSAEDGQGLGLALSSTILGWIAMIQQLVVTVNQARSAIQAFFGQTSPSVSPLIAPANAGGIREAGGGFLRSIPGLGGVADRIFGTPEQNNPAQAAASRRQAEAARLTPYPGNIQARAIERPQNNVQITGAPTTITVNGAQNPEETARAVRREYTQLRASENRAILSVIEPSRRGAS